MQRTVKYSVTFDVVTPESAEQGDFAETGFALEDRPVIVDEDETLVEACAAIVERHCGHCEASSWPDVDSGTWFTQADGDIDYTDGSETRESVHFEGLTDDETRAVAAILKTRGLL